MKFSYVEYGTIEEQSSISIFRPVVPIYLRHADRTVRRLGVVDTGSDFTLLPSWVASALGISLGTDEPIPLSAVDGRDLLARPGVITFELRQDRVVLRWTAVAHFADQQYVLLGNAGFLEFFVATFDWGGRTLDLTPNARYPMSDPK